MNLYKNNVDLIPGKLYSVLWNTGFPVWKPSGTNFVHDTFLNRGSVVFYAGVIKTDIFKIVYYEFLYMARLIYIVTPSKKYNIFKQITIDSL